MEFKDRLKNLRLNRGLSQAKLADMLDVSSSLIGLYETGKRKPSYEKIEYLASVFGVSVDYLMGKADESEVNQMNFGEKVKELRRSKGLTQEALGEIIGVKKSAINKYEKGRVVNIKRDNLQKLADALGVRSADLYDDDFLLVSSEDHSDIEKKETEHYIDIKTKEIVNELKNNTGLRLLLDAGRDLTPEEILKTLDFIKNRL